MTMIPQRWFGDSKCLSYARYIIPTVFVYDPLNKLKWLVLSKQTVISVTFCIEENSKQINKPAIFKYSVFTPE